MTSMQHALTLMEATVVAVMQAMKEMAFSAQVRMCEGVFSPSRIHIINNSLPLQMWMNVQTIEATTAVRMDTVLTPLGATHVYATVDSLEMDSPVQVHT